MESVIGYTTDNSSNYWITNTCGTYRFIVASSFSNWINYIYSYSNRYNNWQEKWGGLMNGILKTIIFVILGTLGYLMFGYLGLFLVLLGWFLEA